MRGGSVWFKFEGRGPWRHARSDWVDRKIYPKKKYSQCMGCARDLIKFKLKAPNLYSSMLFLLDLLYRCVSLQESSTALEGLLLGNFLWNETSRSDPKGWWTWTRNDFRVQWNESRSHFFHLKTNITYYSYWNVKKGRWGVTFSSALSRNFIIIC